MVVVTFIFFRIDLMSIITLYKLNLFYLGKVVNFNFREIARKDIWDATFLTLKDI